MRRWREVKKECFLERTTVGCKWFKLAFRNALWSLMLNLLVSMSGVKPLLCKSWEDRH